MNKIEYKIIFRMRLQVKTRGKNEDRVRIYDVFWPL